MRRFRFDGWALLIDVGSPCRAWILTAPAPELEAEAGESIEDRSPEAGPLRFVLRAHDGNVRRVLSREEVLRVLPWIPRFSPPDLDRGHSRMVDHA
jgi:hypothetical protein